MRILYGVHGYGRGHATRTFAVLPHLTKNHQVLVLAGGDAFPALSHDYPTVRIPTLGFAYGQKSGQRSNFQTFRRNISAILDIFFKGPVFDMVREIVADFAPDVIISDAESWTHSVAHSLRIPRISFDHIGILAYCRPPIDWQDRVEAWLDAQVYRGLMGQPDRILVSSFYPAPPSRPTVRVVGTLPRQAVRNVSPTVGDHVLAYFNRGDEQLSPRILETFEALDRPIHIYGSSRQGRQGRLTFLPQSNLPFLEDLASCFAVVSTAGNQLIGEAAFLGKPCLVIPERCVEQRMNAAAVQRLGIGVKLTPRTFTLKNVQRFLNQRDDYVKNIAQVSQDGLPAAIEALEAFFQELAPAAYGKLKTVQSTAIAFADSLQSV